MAVSQEVNGPLMPGGVEHSRWLTLLDLLNVNGPLMPGGVEHRRYHEWNGDPEEVNGPLMPGGVEHLMYTLRKLPCSLLVNGPLMPGGVEHLSINPAPYKRSPPIWAP